MIAQSIIDYATSIESELLLWRHTLHQHPEIAYNEHWTSDYIATRLTEFGFNPHRGLAGTGIVATLKGRPGRTIGLRSDIDALPIHETLDLPYASQNPGLMHACGHDGHMAMLLGAAKYFAQHPDISGTLHFIFQPAEEVEGGAERMIQDGLFDLFPMDEIYGLHKWPGLPPGTFAGRPGPQMAAFDTFEINIEGQAAHAAMPHLGKDVLVAAAAIQSQLQTIVARNVDPMETAVISVTQIHAGDSWNALPSSLVMRGCTRHFTPQIQSLIKSRMSDVVEGAARSCDVDAKLSYFYKYPATINAAPQTQTALAAARAVVGSDQVITTFNPSMASEDFAFMLNKVKGAYFWLGAGSTENGCVLHSPTYRFNDAILTTGVAWWVNLALLALRTVE